jgi:hypothetical protein
MNRSPLQLSRIPPSPRTPSVMSTPAPATPVGMELPELHVLERNAGARRHAEAVSGVDERVRRRGEDAAGAARGEHRRLGLQDRDLARLHLQRHHAQHVAFGVADEVERHPFDEKVRARADVALVERVQQRVPVRSAAAHERCTAFSPKFAEWPAERPLVDRAVGVAVERHPEVLELVDDLRAIRHMYSIASWSPSQSSP